MLENTTQLQEDFNKDGGLPFIQLEDMGTGCTKDQDNKDNFTTKDDNWEQWVWQDAHEDAHDTKTIPTVRQFPAMTPQVQTPTHVQRVPTLIQMTKCATMTDHTTFSG